MNDEGYYSGLTDVDTAMTHSLNTVAVKVLAQLGLENSYDFLTEKFGITTLVKDYETSTGVIRSDLNYAPLALGGLTKGVTTLEMAAAYATFPRDGQYSSPYLYTVVTDSNGKILLSNGDYSVKVDENGSAVVTGQAKSEAILSQATTFYMNLMLQHVVTNGTGKLAKLSNMTAAGKTGTTTNDYDRWFVGYTPYYTAAVWSGYDRQERINSVGNPSCILWQKVMSAVSEGDADIGFNGDLETTTAYCCTASGLLATKACTAAGCGKKQTFFARRRPHRLLRPALLLQRQHDPQLPAHRRRRQGQDSGRGVLYPQKGSQAQKGDSCGSGSGRRGRRGRRGGRRGHQGEQKDRKQDQQDETPSPGGRGRGLTCPLLAYTHPQS